MKRLYLIRHAKSSKDLTGIKDKDRPLKQTGKKGGPVYRQAP